MRDFEQEYKNYIKEDVPDLWDRIEPNLKEKPVSIDEKKQGNNILYLSKRIVPAVACVAVLVICISIFSKNKSNYSSAPASDEAPMAESICATSESAADMEETCEEAAYDDEESYASDVAESETAAETATASEDASNVVNASNTKDVADNTADNIANEMLSGVEILEVIDAPQSLMDAGYTYVLQCAYLTESSEKVETFYVVVPEKVMTEIVLETNVTYNFEVLKNSEILESSDLSEYQSYPLFMLVSVEKTR